MGFVSVKEKLYMELVYKDLILRSISKEDTDDILKWRNSEHVRKYFIYQEEIKKEDHLNWLKNKVDTGSVIQFMILNKVDRSSVGSVYLKDIDYTNQKAEYGIFIGEETMTNQGIGSMAARCMIEYAFRNLNLHKLYLRVYEDNYRAISSYTKAGFKKVALLEDDVLVHGEFTNMILMEIVNKKECMNENIICNTLL